MAIELFVPRDEINPDALKEQIVAIVGLDAPLRFGRGEVHVTLPESLPAAKVNQVRQAILSHDPAVLSTLQQADLLRRQKLDQARRDYQGVEIDLTAYNGQNPLLIALARKIAWLEREIALLTATR